MKKKRMIKNEGLSPLAHKLLGIILGLSLFALAPSFSEESPWKFSVIPEIGIKFGSITEFLYASYSERVISELDWNETPVFDTGLKLNAGYKNFGIEGQIGYSLPFGCGKMTDSDWVIPDVKTNLGEFQNIQKKNVTCDLTLYYDFKLNSAFELTPILNARYRYTSFSTETGNGWYGDSSFSLNGENVSWDSEYAKKVRLSGIDYTLTSLNTFIGLKSSFIFNKIKLSQTVLFSPYSIYYATDYHRDDRSVPAEDKTDFTSLMLMDDMFASASFTTDLDWTLNKNINLIFSLNLFLTPVINGETATDRLSGKTFGFTDTNKWKIINQKSGIEIIETSFNFGLKYIF